MLKLGEKIFFADIENNKVKAGVVCGHSINGQGFEVYAIKGDDGVWSENFATLCAGNEKQLSDKLPTLVALNKEIKEVTSKANRKIDELLELIRGKPKFEHLTEKGK